MAAVSNPASVEEGPREKADEVFVERNEDISELPDPDAGKSYEELAAFVSGQAHATYHENDKLICERIANSCGKWTSGSFHGCAFCTFCRFWTAPSTFPQGSRSHYVVTRLTIQSIGNARLAGLETDLGMVGHDYNNSLTIFFVCAFHNMDVPQLISKT